MRPFLTLLVLAACTFSMMWAAPSDSPLTLYQGTWHVTTKSAGANAKPEEIRNQCASLGKFFTCQQIVNGSVTALLVFVTTNQPGHYVVQNIFPDGRASGKSYLEIAGNRWVYSNSWNQGSKTTHYQTINTFLDKNHIHFEQQESSDGVHWETKDSGDETRISPSK